MRAFTVYWNQLTDVTQIKYNQSFPDWSYMEKVDVLDEEPSFMCNSCHEHFPREEMDFDVDNDQDLCKNCNYQSYNEAPYGED